MATDWSKWVYTKTATPYLDSYNKLANQYQEQAKTDIAGINDRQTTDLNKSNAQYDNTARQNYINYMQAQKRLPSQLNALGIRGGASESSALRLGTNYGTNVATNEAARNSAAEQIRQAYAQQIADYNKDLNERLAQAKATAEQNQITFEREQLDKDLERFSGVIEGLYTKKSGYEKLIEQLQKSNDPNKEYKIMLARRAMNQLKGSGGGGGGGRSYGRSYGGYSNYSNNNTSSYTPTRNGSLTNGGTQRYVNRDTGSSGRSSRGGNKSGGNNKGKGTLLARFGRTRRSISRGNGIVW
jgi:hypothetical protein